MSDLTVPTPATMPTRAQLALLGFLARYSGRTLRAYQLHMRLFFDWCATYGLDPLEAQRTHLELYRHYLETERGNAVSTVALRLNVLRSFYKFAVIDGYVDRDPALHLNLPRVYRDDSRLTGVERHELGALLATAKAADPTRWALVALMGLLGLRVTGRGMVAGLPPLPTTVRVRSEACGIQIEAAGPTCDRRRRRRRPAGRGLRRRDGNQLDPRTAHRWIRALAKKAGVNEKIHPHSLRHAFVTLSLDAGVPLRDVQFAARHSDPRMTERYDRNRGSMDRHAAHYLSAYVAGAA